MKQTPSKEGTKQKKSTTNSVRIRRQTIKERQCIELKKNSFHLTLISLTSNWAMKASFLLFLSSFCERKRRRHPLKNVVANASAKNQKQWERSDGFFHHRLLNIEGRFLSFFYVYNIAVAFVFVTTTKKHTKNTSKRYESHNSSIQQNEVRKLGKNNKPKQLPRL